MALHDSALKWQVSPTHRVFDTVGPVATLDIGGLGACRPPTEKEVCILASKTLSLVCEERLTAQCGGTHGVGADRTIKR